MRRLYSLSSEGYIRGETALICGDTQYYTSSRVIVVNIDGKNCFRMLITKTPKNPKDVVGICHIKEYNNYDREPTQSK